MRAALVLLIVLLLAPLGWNVEASTPATLVLSEIVADPQQDWDGDARVGTTDEYIEIENPATEAVSMDGWRLLLNDTTPASLALVGAMAPGSRLVLQNPPGELNNNGHVALIDAGGRVVDEVRFGSWPGAGGLASADASSVWDEALARTDGRWGKRHATPAAGNDAPQLRETLAWANAPVGGWLAAGSWGWANVTVVHVDPILQGAALRLRAGENVTDVGRADLPAPGRRLAASFEVRAPGTDFALAWDVDTATGPAATLPHDVRVDGAPPVLPAFPAHAWVNSTPLRWTPPEAFDAGVGGVEWQWAPANGTASNWSADRTLVAGPAGWSWRARTRDALGHASDWGPHVTVDLDAEPPPAVSGLAVAGEAPFRVSWGVVLDPVSGVGRVEIRRALQDAGADWALPPDAVALNDTVEPGRAELAYGVRAVDLAGNVGPWAWAVADHEERHPAVVGVRVRKAAWGSGVQEVRVDFDRPMDATRAPLVALDGSEPDHADGRFLANRSTYYVRWDSPLAWDEGVHTFRVADATSGEGATLRAPAEASFRVDRAPPILAVEPAGGWTNATVARIRVDDAGSARTEWRLWSGPAEPSLPNGTAATAEAEVALPSSGEWNYRVGATDDAGNRATDLRGRWRIDRASPTVGAPTFDGRRFLLPAADEGSGVDWTSPPVLSGWTVTADPRAAVFALTPPGPSWSGTAAGVVADVAGNGAPFRIDAAPAAAAHSPEPPAPSPLTAGSGLAARVADLPTVTAEPEAAARPAWPWVAGALVTVAGGAGAAGAWRFRRGPSFARLIKAAKRRDEDAGP